MTRTIISDKNGDREGSEAEVNEKLRNALGNSFTIETPEMEAARIAKEAENRAKVVRWMSLNSEMAVKEADGRISEKEAYTNAALVGLEGDLSELMKRAKSLGTIRRDEGEEDPKATKQQQERDSQTLALARAVADTRAAMSGILQSGYSGRCFYVAEIKPLEIGTASAGGIILPDSPGPKPSIGLVLSVGAGFVSQCRRDDITPPSPGDLVVFSRYGGQECDGMLGRVVYVTPKEVFKVLPPQLGVPF
jgi:co-chaperonin GroES (HSP10)